MLNHPYLQCDWKLLKTVFRQRVHDTPPPTEYVNLSFFVHGVSIVSCGNVVLRSEQYRAWSDCLCVEAGLAVHWGPSPVTITLSGLVVKGC